MEHQTAGQFIVTTASGDFWLGPTIFTSADAAQRLADKTPGHVVRPLNARAAA